MGRVELELEEEVLLALASCSAARMRAAPRVTTVEHPYFSMQRLVFAARLARAFARRAAASTTVVLWGLGNGLFASTFVFAPTAA